MEIYEKLTTYTNFLTQAEAALHLEETLGEIIGAGDAPATVHLLQAHRIAALKALVNSLREKLNSQSLNGDLPDPEPETPAE